MCIKSTIFTPRLKLTLIEKAERGSPELEWLHELRSNEQATWWSLHGPSKSLEDTEKLLKNVLPTDPEVEKTYRIIYAVHEILDNTASTDNQDASSHFIGLITLRSQIPISLPEANHLFPPSTRDPASSVLTVELGYLFLPSAWSHGFATESLAAAFGAYRAVPREFWAPFEKVYVQAVVDASNGGSLGVMRKSELSELGVHVWEGEEVWMAGGMKGRMELSIWGMWLVE